MGRVQIFRMLSLNGVHVYTTIRAAPTRRARLVAFLVEMFARYAVGALKKKAEGGIREFAGRYAQQNSWVRPNANPCSEVHSQSPCHSPRQIGR